MTVLDGNSIAGVLRSAFGVEMTTAVGTCATCGASSPLAELRVYLDAPGVVGRCANCESVLLVIMENRGIACVDVSGLAALDQPTRV
jgi:DNA-directed RNA polymerase subunit RPC12/RpoP